MLSVLLPIALHAGLSDPAALARETKAFAGTWAVTGMVMNGIEIPEGAYKGMRFEFAENKVNAYHGKDLIADGKFKVVAVVGKQVWFDIAMGKGPDEGKTFPGVNVWIDGKAFKSCLAQPNQKRPVEVVSEANDRRAVFELKRMDK